MPQQSYYCSYCKYLTNHKAKYHRHLETLKHKIAVDGIVCCGLQYFDKHRWVNHKKSVKHHANKLKLEHELEEKIQTEEVLDQLEEQSKINQIEEREPSEAEAEALEEIKEDNHQTEPTVLPKEDEKTEEDEIPVEKGSETEKGEHKHHRKHRKKKKKKRKKHHSPDQVEASENLT